MFKIIGLKRDEFSRIFDYDDIKLKEKSIYKIIADKFPAFPCRISLEYAQIGEEVYLLNYEHQKANTPYNSKYAIFIRKNAIEINLAPNEIAPVFNRDVPISIRGFDKYGFLKCAEIINGKQVKDAFIRLLQNEEIDYLHTHFAAFGCYIAKIIRA